MNRFTILLLAASVLPAYAHQNGVTFEHKNWELACDNTLTCRMAGYAKEEDPSGSVLITRPAGANTIPTGEVTLGDTEEEENAKPISKLTLWIDGKSAGELTAAKGNWPLSESQTLAVIKAIKGDGRVEFKGGRAPFLLSGEGAYAVMLKADDVQGRIGTPGALTKKGDKQESSVSQAFPAPVIQAAKVSASQSRPLTDTELVALKPRLLATVNHNDEDLCDRLFPTEENDLTQDRLSVTELDEQHALLSGLCWRAAYNEGIAYWVIDRQLKGKPKLVTLSGTDYDKGEIYADQKGRGIADCISSESWIWDGKAFRKSSEATTGMCRYIHLGGTWELPTLVTEVRHAF